jgi:hypothetical protein
MMLIGKCDKKAIFHAIVLSGAWFAGMALCLNGDAGTGVFHDVSPARLFVGKELTGEALIPAFNLAMATVAPSPHQTPTVSGVTSPECTVEIFSGSGCTGSLLATGVSDGGGAFALTSSALMEGAYALSVRTRGLGGQIVCSSSVLGYVVGRAEPTVSFNSR